MHCHLLAYAFVGSAWIIAIQFTLFITDGLEHIVRLIVHIELQMQTTLAARGSIHCTGKRGGYVFRLCRFRLAGFAAETASRTGLLLFT